MHCPCTFLQQHREHTWGGQFHTQCYSRHHSDTISALTETVITHWCYSGVKGTDVTRVLRSELNLDRNNNNSLMSFRCEGYKRHSGTRGPNWTRIILMQYSRLHITLTPQLCRSQKLYRCHRRLTSGAATRICSHNSYEQSPRECSLITLKHPAAIQSSIFLYFFFCPFFLLFQTCSTLKTRMVCVDWKHGRVVHSA